MEKLKFTDTTVDLSDTVAPTVTERTPAADAVNVAVDANATATFSEAVTGVDGTSVTLANPAGGNIAAAVTYDEATRTATLNPTANLAANTRYTVTLANTIGDANGNKLAATTWSFTTAGVAPTVTGRTPAADAVNVAVGTNATATFSEAVTGVGVGTMTLTNPAGNTIPAAVTYANGTATLNPNANLATNTRYTVKLTNGIRGTDGTPLAATEWSFTTAAPVVDPAPTVTGRTPAVERDERQRLGQHHGNVQRTRHGSQPHHHAVDQLERRRGSGNGELQRDHPDRDAEPAAQPGRRHPLHGVADQRHQGQRR